jgi:glycosyltransferase involved in cell wall biosynthesis
MPAHTPLAPDPAARQAPRPHLCFVAPTAWPVFSAASDIPLAGGAELQQSVIARALAARGYRVSMITMDHGQRDGVEIDGVTLYKMHKPDEGIPVVRFLHPRLTSLWRAMKRADADIYYARSCSAQNAFLAAFCKGNGRRSIYAGASDIDFIPGEEAIVYARDRWLHQYGVRNVDRIFVQNPNQQESVKRHYGRDAVIVPNCFAERARARPERAAPVLWVGNLRPDKRAEMLLELARRLPAQRFVMVGGDVSGAGAYARGIREAAAGLANLEVTGFLPFDEADRYFDRARLLLNTSTYEGFPNTFLQAWARGVPTVATVDTGFRRDGSPVYDVVAGVEEAAARIERLSADDLAWREASQRVLEHFREMHSIEAVARLYDRELGALTRRAA